MTQKEYVIEAMKSNGGYATFHQLNMMIDFSGGKTKHLSHLLGESFKLMKNFSEYSLDYGH